MWSRGASILLLAVLATGCGFNSVEDQVAPNHCAPGFVRCAADCCPVAGISAGDQTACSLDDAGSLRCWGPKTEVMGGAPCPSMDCTSPRPIVGLESGVTRVSIGNSHQCAVLGAGGIRCWGMNSSGELGTGDDATVSSLVTVAGLSATPIDVSAGNMVTCALVQGGAVECWGLGSGFTPTPVALPRPATAIAAGSMLCAILDDATLACDRDPSTGITMDAVAGLTNVTRVCAGAFHTCAVAGGDVYCWGNNQNLQCGQDPALPGNDVVAAPSAVGGLSSAAVDVVCGLTHSCALLASGEVWCWGQSDLGQLGRLAPSGTSLPYFTFTPVMIPLSGIVAIASGGVARFNCALTGAGKVACWGSNLRGELGAGRDLAYTATPQWLASP